MNFKEEMLKRNQAGDMEGCLKILADSLSNWSAPKVLELGTWNGDSTIAFMSNIRAGHLTSIDIKRFPIVDLIEKESPQFKFILGRSEDFKSEHKFNVILVDTLHNYEQVKKECSIIEPLIGPGTKVFFHDTIFRPEIIPAIEEFISRHKCNVIKYGVKKGLWEVRL